MNFCCGGYKGQAVVTGLGLCNNCEDAPPLVAVIYVRLNNSTLDSMRILTIIPIRIIPIIEIHRDQLAAWHCILKIFHHRHKVHQFVRCGALICCSYSHHSSSFPPNFGRWLQRFSPIQPQELQWCWAIIVGVSVHPKRCRTSLRSLLSAEQSSSSSQTG